MKENNVSSNNENKKYKYKEGNYTVTVSFAGQDSLENSLARYIERHLERKIKKF